MARFAGIPEIPTEGLTDWQVFILAALKENVELLTGSRNESDNASMAVTKGQITSQGLPPATIQQVSGIARGTVAVPGLTGNSAQDIANVRAALQASLQIIRALATDVQILIDDNLDMRDELNRLIAEIKR